MSSPLNTATFGFLDLGDCYSLSTATRGRLSCDVIEEVVEEIKKSGGGSTKTLTVKKVREITKDRLYLEDDDIMIIIKAFLRCQE